MVLVLFFAIILFLLILLIVFMLISTIEIKVKGIELSNIKKITPSYVINISAKLLNKFKWIGIDLDNGKIKKITKKVHLEKIDIQKLERNLKISDIREIINIKPKISSLNLHVNVGLEDVILTTYLVTGISTIIAIILPYITKKNSENNLNYKVLPIYNNQNVYYLKIDTILEIKVMNVLSSLFKIYKDNKYNEKVKKVSRSTVQNV